MLCSACAKAATTQRAGHTGHKHASEEGEVADGVAEEDVVLKVVQIHDVFEDKLKVRPHQVKMLLHGTARLREVMCALFVLSPDVHSAGECKHARTGLPASACWGG